MKSPIQIRVAAPTDHFSEILLLALIAGGCILLARDAIAADKAGEASAWTAVLMAIISAIKERWTQRSVDRMGQQLGQSQPLDTSGAPENAQEAADQMLDASKDEAAKIKGKGKP